MGNKNIDAFISGIGICYKTYKRKDFLGWASYIANRFPEAFKKSGKKVEDIAKDIFDLCEWQFPQTVVDEIDRDPDIYFGFEVNE